MKLFTLALVSLIASAAFAETGFEKMKRMFDSAAAPVSVQAVIAKIPSIKACAMFRANSTSYTQELVMVEYTEPGVGPEFPPKNYRGVGLMGAGDRPAAFFSTYKEVLNAQGLQISYSYQYSEIDCDDTDCDTSHYSRAANANIRMSSQYLLISHQGDYGYCWF